jgi:hypothetical protein
MVSFRCFRTKYMAMNSAAVLTSNAHNIGVICLPAVNTFWASTGATSIACAITMPIAAKIARNRLPRSTLIFAVAVNVGSRTSLTRSIAARKTPPRLWFNCGGRAGLSCGIARCVVQHQAGGFGILGRSAVAHASGLAGGTIAGGATLRSIVELGGGFAVAPEARPAPRCGGSSLDMSTLSIACCSHREGALGPWPNYD